MTPAEHAKVWIEICRAYAMRGDHEGNLLANFSADVAAAYEQSAKEQEGRD